MAQPSRNDNFTLLGDAARPLGTRVMAIAETFRLGGTYDVVSHGSEYWLRCKDHDGTRPEAVQRVALVSKCDSQIIRVSAAVASFENSDYGKQHLQYNATLELEGIIDALEDADMSTPSTDGWETLAKALVFAPRGSLMAVLADHVAPRFFDWHPSGQLSLYIHDRAFERRFGELRMARVACQFDITTFNPHVPDSLGRWQRDSPPHLFSMLANWGTCLLFPHVTGMVLGIYGFPVIFTDDAAGHYAPPTYPLSLLDMKHGESVFGQERSALQITGKSIKISKFSHLGRYFWEEPHDGAASLLDFIVKQAERLIRALSDITNYERLVDGTKQIDLLLCQEQMWTIGRIIRRTLHLQSAESRWLNRTCVFEIADQWSELIEIWAGGHAVAHFKTLFHPVSGLKKIQACFAVLPTPWRDRFLNEAKRSYEQLTLVHQHSVWAKQRVSVNGVDVSSSGPPAIESWDDFIANIIRDIRNTHHGYIPEKEKSRSRLVLSTGEWAPSLTFLPSLWLLAFLSDPRQFMAWPPRPDGW